MVEVRVATPQDAPGIAAIWREVVPFLVKTAGGIAAELRSGSSRRVLVAADGTDVLGVASAWPPDSPGAASRVSVLVRPDARRQGIGSSLADQVSGFAADAGASLLRATVGADGKDFAAHRGFAIGRELSHSRALLADLPEPEPVPDGFRLADFTELDPRDVWAAYQAVADDDPSGLSTVPPYDEWLAVEWEHPDHALDLGIAVLDTADETLASFVSTSADRERGAVWSNLTGTRPAYRGKGLAKVVKSHALARCRAAGMTEALTGNDARNLPMLAVNAWLGYRVAGSQWTAEKEV
jgi:GNAT superfamily N-acetyltransferase